MRRLAPLAAILALAPALPAEAHPHVVSADPPVGAATTTHPSAISITFSEPLFIRISGVVLKDAHGHVVPTGRPFLDPANDHRMVVPVASPLAAGAYTVNWRAVSADTHRVQGSYAFTVR